MSKLVPGLHGRKELVVTPAMLASSVGSGLVDVFSTAMMVAWMEATAVEVVQGLLEDGQTTVGTGIQVAHLAATPCGMAVRFEAELTDVSPNGKGLSFKVAAYDAAGLIGEGTHQRVVVVREKFEARAQAKGQASA
ncbi:thioesterase family protein [Desulfovibrio legallii]|uniref:Thioesterase n=1 Tax=Desulfovibrio legallii TaxID=571438 RepID=A0A6H3FCT9_9BACT|nr:thioesterase family protein [Desulfovibrio legallii]TBH80717.1 thioesterase [Desulfovibrio legallii]